jgi:hypothetical protein
MSKASEADLATVDRIVKAAAATPAQPLQIRKEALAFAETRFNGWWVDVPDRTTREDLESPHFWSFVADSLRTGDVLTCMTTDRARLFECRVLRGGYGLNNQVAGSTVIVRVRLEDTLPEQTVTGIAWPKGFTPTREHDRWVVRRDKDGVVMVEAATELEAWSQLQRHATLRNG